MEAKYIEIAESTRTFPLRFSLSLLSPLSLSSFAPFFSKSRAEMARFSSCATLVNVTAAATLGEPRPSPQKSSLPRAHNGPRFAPWGPFFPLAAAGTSPPEFLSPSLFLSALLFFLRLFLRSFLASFVAILLCFPPTSEIPAESQPNGSFVLSNVVAPFVERNGIADTRALRCRSTRRNPPTVRWYRSVVAASTDWTNRFASKYDRGRGTVSRSNRPRCATNLKSDQRRTVNWRTPRRMQEGFSINYRRIIAPY